MFSEADAQNAFLRDGIKVAYQTESRMSKSNFRDRNDADIISSSVTPLKSEMTAFLSVFRVIILVILKQQLPLLSRLDPRLMSFSCRLFPQKKKKMDKGEKQCPQ